MGIKIKAWLRAQDRKTPESFGGLEASTETYRFLQAFRRVILVVDRFQVADGHAGVNLCRFQ